MRALELVRQRIGERIRLVQRLLGFRREVAERRRVQIRAVIALGEAVDEDLPVALQLGLEPIHLVRPVKGIALDAMRQFAEVDAQRLGVVGVEVDEDEALPHLALNCGHPAAVGVEVQQQILPGG